MEHTADWKDTIMAPSNKVVMTKYDDGSTVGQERALKRVGEVWFTPDETQYVTYSPTHWNYLN